jgi:hypothetical protein
MLFLRAQSNLSMSTSARFVARVSGRSQQVSAPEPEPLVACRRRLLALEVERTDTIGAPLPKSAARGK